MGGVPRGAPPFLLLIAIDNRIGPLTIEYMKDAVLTIRLPRETRRRIG